MRSRLEALRKARGWSRLELATHANVTESTIIRAERSNPPAIRTASLAAIAGALDVSVAELLEPPVGDRDVLFLPALAVELRSSVRRLRAILKSDPDKLPAPLPALDNRARWSRIAVERWLEERRDKERRARRLAAGVRRGPPPPRPPSLRNSLRSSGSPARCT